MCPDAALFKSVDSNIHLKVDTYNFTSHNGLRSRKCLLPSATQELLRRLAFSRDRNATCPIWSHTEHVALHVLSRGVWVFMFAHISSWVLTTQGSCFAKISTKISVWLKVFKFCTHIRHLKKSHWAKYYFDWPDGGAKETVQSCELWKAVSQYVVQTWNFAHLCLSSQWTNLPQEPISPAYLDFPPFWIWWKTPKNLLLLQGLTKLHEIWYT